MGDTGPYTEAKWVKVKPPAGEPLAVAFVIGQRLQSRCDVYVGDSDGKAWEIVQDDIPDSQGGVLVADDASTLSERAIAFSPNIEIPVGGKYYVECSLVGKNSQLIPGSTITFDKTSQGQVVWLWATWLV